MFVFLDVRIKSYGANTNLPLDFIYQNMIIYSFQRRFVHSV